MAKGIETRRRTPLRVIPSQATVIQIRQQHQKKNLTALGWIAGIALGLIALSELLGKETVRRKFLAEAGEE
jgi:hypothetical protein